MSSGLVPASPVVIWAFTYDNNYIIGKFLEAITLGPAQL